MSRQLRGTSTSPIQKSPSAAAKRDLPALVWARTAPWLTTAPGSDACMDLAEGPVPWTGDWTAALDRAHEEHRPILLCFTAPG